MKTTMKTKVHELLGVEPGEAFEVKGYGGQYHTDPDGTIRCNRQGEQPSSWMAMLINHPERIIRLPRYTPEQVKVMRALVVLGYTHVTKDKEDGQIKAHETLPVIYRTWWSSTGGGACGEKIDCLRLLIPDWTVPLDLLAALRDAGEVTSDVD